MKYHSPRRAVLLVVASGSLLGIPALGQPPQPSDIVRTVDYSIPLARTLEQRLGEVGAALRVRIVGDGEARPFDEPVDPSIRQRVLALGPPQPLVITHYQAEVIEVVKPHPRAGVSGIVVPLLLVGGTVDVGATRYVTFTGLPALVPDGEYLVFLNYNEMYGGLLISPFDIFRVDTKSVEAGSYGRATAYGMALIGREPAEALTAVRVAAERLAAGAARAKK